MRQLAVLIVLGTFVLFPLLNCGSDSPASSDEGEELTATITGPPNEETFTDDEVITFTGAGTDPEDGDLTGISLSWSSNVTGVLGTGISVMRDDLSEGAHVITLTATDSDDNTATDVITIYVESDPGPAPFDMIAVPATAGFEMGYINIETPIHTVSLDAYHIGKYEVTYELWTTVRDWSESNGYEGITPGAKGNEYITDEEGYPVTYVTWHDCVAWCNAYSEMNSLTPIYYNAGQAHTHANVYRNSDTGGDIEVDDVAWGMNGFRLPTEAEWEYAARYMPGGITAGNQHSGYNIDSDPDNCAWYGSSSGNAVHKIGENTANSLGAYDMSGNVKEWCWDWKGAYPDMAVDNPTGATTENYRVIRGGYWHGYLVECYTSNRFGQYATLGNSYCGLRVLRRATGN